MCLLISGCSYERTYENSAILENLDNTYLCIVFSRATNTCHYFSSLMAIDPEKDSENGKLSLFINENAF